MQAMAIWTQQLNDVSYYIRTVGFTINLYYWIIGDVKGGERGENRREKRRQKKSRGAGLQGPRITWGEG